MRLSALTTGLSLVLAACGGGGTAIAPAPPVPPVSQTLDVGNLLIIGGARVPK